MNARSAVDSFHAWDRKLIEHAPRSERLDRYLIRLTHSANHSGLWLVLAAALAAKRGPTRRAALRGVFAIGVSSAIANAGMKPLMPRPRPPLHAIPVNRKLIKLPTSSSFPSGHSASAFAFATAVSLEVPAAGFVLFPLAATVAYSRVHVGVHWPSDVIAGAAIGVVVANRTRRWWPVARSGLVSLGEADEVVRCEGGEGLLLLVNPSSGTGSGASQLTEQLPAATIIRADIDGDVGAQLRAAIEKARPRALGVVGGDGSVNTAATVAVEAGLPLAVFPGGTLNHYARDTSATEASTLRSLKDGTVRHVDLASVTVDGGEQVFFINTASLGPYPKVVRIREKLENRIGKWPAAAIAAARVMRRATPLHIIVDGVSTSVWMIFIGNGTYRPADGLPLARESLAEGQLDVRYLRADVKGARVRAALAMTTGMLSRSHDYVRELAAKVTVAVDDEVALATDGEVSVRGRQFEFAAMPGAIRQFAE